MSTMTRNSLLWLLVISSAGLLYAQGGAFGTILGTVKDNSGAALKNYPNFEEAHLGVASVFVSTQKPELALPHLLKAIELNAQSEVAWYRLGQAQKALGNSAAQQKALAEYRRLHDKASEQSELGTVFSHREVTKQAVDPNAQ